MHSPRHHGLVVLAACSLLTVATSAGHSTGINVFVEFFIHDLDVSRTAFSGIWSLALALSSIATPVAGLVLDRFGVRATVLLEAAGRASGDGMSWKMVNQRFSVVGPCYELTTLLGRTLI